MPACRPGLGALWRAVVLLVVLCAAYHGRAAPAADGAAPPVAPEQPDRAAAPVSAPHTDVPAAGSGDGEAEGTCDAAAAAGSGSVGAATDGASAAGSASSPAPEPEHAQRVGAKDLAAAPAGGPPLGQDAAAPPVPSDAAPAGKLAEANGTDGAAQQPAADGTAAEQAAPAQEQQAAAEAPAAAGSTPPLPPGDALHDEQQHNFALAKDGAKVVAANKEAKKAPALLDDDSDTFLKNDCKADKWVIVELSQVATVRRLELAQFELYSARVRDFEAWGRQSHPRTDGFGSEYARTLNSTQWSLLGNFTAEKAKGSQLFVVDSPLWVRYLLLRFLSQHGPEPVCAVNGISVFGRSAAEELEDQLASAAEDSLHLLHPDLAPQPGAAEPPPAPPAAGDAGGEAPPAAAASSSAAVEGDTAGQPGQQHEEPAAPSAGDQRHLQPPQQQQGEDEGEQQQGEQQGAAAASGGGGVNASEATQAAGSPPSADPAAAPTGGNGASTAGAPAAQQPHAAVPSPASGTGSVSAANETAASPATEPAASEPAGNTTEPDAAAQLQANSSSVAGVAPTDKAVSANRTGNVTAEPAAPAATASTSAPVQPAAAVNDSVNGTADPVGQPVLASPMPATQQQEAQPPAPAAPAASSAGGSSAAQPPPAAAPPPAAPPAEGMELPLAGLGGKAKGGTSVYELLVQEIKTAKLQQKLLTKSVVELQRNASSQYAELAGDIAGLAAALSKLPADHNATDEELAARVDALVKAHLVHVATQMLGLQAALASAAKQQHALVCFLAMLGGVLALNATRFAVQWPRAKWLILLLAAANGLVGVVLQLQGGLARQPSWLQALPWGE